MKTEKILSDFLKDVYTKKEALRKFDILEEFLFEKFFREKEKERIAPPPLKNLSPEFFKSFTRENVIFFLKELEKKIEEKEPLILYLPFFFPEKEIKKIGEFVKKRIDENILLEFRENKDLIGGCVLIWHGKYRDFSLKKELREKRSEILKIISQYLK